MSFRFRLRPALRILTGKYSRRRRALWALVLDYGRRATEKPILARRVGIAKRTIRSEWLCAIYIGVGRHDNSWVLLCGLVSPRICHRSEGRLDYQRLRLLLLIKGVHRGGRKWHRTDSRLYCNWRHLLHHRRYEWWIVL